MKRIYYIIIVSILLGGFLVSCNFNRGFVSTVTRKDIKQVQQFEPFSYVGIINKGNNIAYSDSLTSISQGLFETALAENSTLPVIETCAIEDSLVNIRVKYEVFLLMNYIENNVRVKDIQIPPVIDSILCAKNERFGLLTYNWGFIRTNSNYNKQLNKGAIIGLLSLGGVYTRPYKELVYNGIIIVDSKNHNIAFVSTAVRESNPLKVETYRKQIVSMLRRYKNKS